MKIERNVNLKKYNLYGTGGSAKYFCICKNIADVRKAFEFATNNKQEWVALGWGSNVLISDAGFDGLVIINQIMGSSIEGDIVATGSGCALASLIQKTAIANLSGFENLAGIPGTVGGAIIGNAGAFGSTISDFLESVEVVGTDERLIKVPKSKIKFGYRSSSLAGQNVIITSAKFRLGKGERTIIQNKIRQNITKKSVEQPKGRTCGSFFKNPKRDFAGGIIESLGFKGERVGGAEISKVHANFIVNTGAATSTDIYNLAKKVNKAAQEKLGIALVEEIKYIGEFN